MRLIWTKSSTILSKTIRWITGEDCSHFSFVFDKDNIMFESNLLGTHPAFYESSLKTHTIVHEIEIKCTQAVEDMVWDRVVKMYDGKGYDFGGALYLGWRKWLKRVFNRPIPSVNKWAKSDLFFCDEIYDALQGVPGLPDLQAGKGLDSPHDVYVKIGNINEVE